MSKASWIAPFLRVDIFDGLLPLQITEIAQNAERMIFRDGDVITRAGEKGYAAYMIVDGRLKSDDFDPVADGREPAATAALDVGEGALISEMAMLVEGHRCAATLIADGPVRAYRISRAALQAQMADDRKLAEHFVGKITTRLRTMAQELHRIDGILAADEQTPVTTSEADTIAVDKTRLAATG